MHYDTKWGAGHGYKAAAACDRRQRLGGMHVSFKQMILFNRSSASLTVHIRLWSQGGVSVECSKNIGVESVLVLIAGDVLPEPVCGELSAHCGKAGDGTTGRDCVAWYEGGADDCSR